MMPATKTIDIAALDQAMRELGAEFDFGPAMKSIRQQVITNTLENFDGEHAPDGTPWKKLKRPRQGPRHQRSRGGYGDKVLSDTGILRQSNTAVGSLGNIDTLTDTSMEWGTNLEYAALHNFGGVVHKPARVRPKGTKPWVFEVNGQTVFTRRIRDHYFYVPQREFIGLSPEQEKRIDDIVADHAQRQIEARLRRLGF